MADYRAIAAICESIVHVLQAEYHAHLFNNELEFEVYVHDNFEQPMAAGISLYLYRVLVDGTHRAPAGRIGDNGRRYRSQLPLNLHFLLTVWGKTASLQHQIAGWMMRIMEDNPILPSGLLNTIAPGVFGPGDTVEVVPADLSTEDLLHLWETLLPDRYQLSVPYVARNVRIESRAYVTEGEPVQERVFDLGEALEPAG
jgi:hypothetical protein